MSTQLFHVDKLEAQSCLQFKSIVGSFVQSIASNHSRKSGSSGPETTGGISKSMFDVASIGGNGTDGEGPKILSSMWLMIFLILPQRAKPESVWRTQSKQHMKTLRFCITSERGSFKLIVAGDFDCLRSSIARTPALGAP